jgi:peroxiredoxin
MLKKIGLYLLLLCSANSISAQNITITGILPGGKGLEIRLITYSDHISYSEIILDRTRIDSLNSFTLQTNLTETQLTFLDLDFYNTIVYLEPGAHYHLLFDSVSINDQYRPFYEKEHLVYRIDPDDPNELNNLISGFNIAYNEFLIDNFRDIYNKRKKGLIESFRLEMEQRYSSIDNKYFKHFITYKLASAELSASSVNKPELFRKYLDAKPILYFHAEYMSFFNQFFDHHLTAGNKYINERDLEFAINKQKSLSVLMETLGKDTLLLSESLRELVLLKGLKDLYYSPYFFQQNILDLLNEVANSSHFQFHKTIAFNLQIILTNLQKGTLAPDFHLINLENDSTSLTEFYGKPIYLSFLNTWTNACLAEFEIMDSLFNVWGSKINFVTVSLDYDLEIISRYRRAKNFTWNFLYNGTQYDLISAYGIKTFPLFVLISSDGKILQYPAYKPSEGVGEYFERLK